MDTPQTIETTKANTNIPQRLRPLIDGFQTDVDAIMNALMAEQITPLQFRELMDSALTNYHTAALTAGQRDPVISPEARKRLEDFITTQLDFLAGFTAVIAARKAAGELDAYEKRFRARANSYTYSIKVPFADGEVIRQVGRPLPLPAMPAQGTQCGNNCGCDWRIVELDKTAGDFDAYWERGKDDSCQTCLVREQLWNGPNGNGSTPVRIRSWQLMPPVGGGQI